MASAKILIVEDDTNLLATLKYNLSRESYDVVTAIDGAQALEVARKEKPDLIILDIMLPELSGYEVCRILRKEMIVPVLMLTAKTEEIDKVVGLEIGADDYMTKPFSMRELLARVRAMIRRTTMTKPQTVDEQQLLVMNDLEIDMARHQALLRKKELELTPKEFDLLSFLVKNKGFVLSREQLLERVWGYDYAGDTRTVDVHVRWLRQKIETDPAHPRRLVTVRGAGYKIDS
ncbi:MAG: response regulator transcription factor [Dehalococcoidia bacterium]|nr:response regulator transcription factor [Dehalococcoidia bacterium]